MYDKLFRQSGIDDLYRKIRDIRICYHPIYGIKESVGYESGIFWSKNNGKQLFLKEKSQNAEYDGYGDDSDDRRM